MMTGVTCMMSDIEILGRIISEVFIKMVDVSKIFASS